VAWLTVAAVLRVGGRGLSLGARDGRARQGGSARRAWPVLAAAARNAMAERPQAAAALLLHAGAHEGRQGRGLRATARSGSGAGAQGMPRTRGDGRSSSENGELERRVCSGESRILV